MSAYSEMLVAIKERLQGLDDRDNESSVMIRQLCDAINQINLRLDELEKRSNNAQNITI